MVGLEYMWLFFLYRYYQTRITVWEPKVRICLLYAVIVEGMEWYSDGHYRADDLEMVPPAPEWEFRSGDPFNMVLCNSHTGPSPGPPPSPCVSYHTMYSPSHTDICEDDCCIRGFLTIHCIFSTGNHKLTQTAKVLIKICEHEVRSAIQNLYLCGTSHLCI